MLTRTISKSKALDFGDDSAVIYDPLNRTLFQGSLRALGREHRRSSIEIPIKNRRTKVDIAVPFCCGFSTSHPPQPKQGDDEFRIYLATVDLCKLGRNVKSGVRAGKIQKVYVLGYVPDRLSSPELDTDEE